jgi:SAM-dependent methyltransferase/transcriptional regulator with XRE-family HTH domain
LFPAARLHYGRAMVKNPSGPYVRRLRTQANLKQKALGALAGCTSRTISTSENANAKPCSRSTQRGILTALAKELKLDPATLFAEVERLQTADSPTSSGRPGDVVPPSIAPPSEVRVPLPADAPSDWLERVVAGAIDGHAENGSVYCFPSCLKRDEDGVLFLVERHVLEPGLADLRAEHAIIQVPVSLEPSFAVFREDRHDDPMKRLGALPFVGTPTLGTLHLPSEHGAADFTVLVTPLCRERTSPAVPRLLSAVLRGGPGHPEPSRERLANWIELASSLATAVWSLHARGWAHFDVSPDNVLVREDRGRWRDVTLINIDVRQGADLQKDTREQRALNEQLDLVGLRDTLVSALVGEAVEVDLEPRQLEALARRVHGEPARRALNLCLRYLIEPAPGAPVETSTELLRKMVHDLGALKALLRSTLARGASARGAVPGSKPLPRRKDEAISALLVAIRESAGTVERKEWCGTYLADAPGTPVDFEGCSRLLAEGHGRAATAALTRLLDEQGATLSKRSTLRSLRLLVGVLLTREGATDEARRILDRYAHHTDPGVAWWVTMLRAKVAYDQAPRGFVSGPLPLFEGEDPAEVRRAEAWRVAHETLFQLARGEAPTREQTGEMERLIHGDASHEAVFGALILARALASRRTVDGFLAAMSALQLAASYSATRKLPHEQAATLAIASALVRGAFSDPVLGPALAGEGVDADDNLVLAADCALLAGELFQWLDVPARSRKAYRAAAACFFACSRTPEHIMEGFRWLGLARNHRILPWAPPDLKPTGLRSDGIAGAGASREDADEREAMTRGVARWHAASVDVPRASTHADPGNVISDNYDDLYGPGIERVYGTGGTTIELVPRRGGDVRVSPIAGSVVSDLLACAERWFDRILPPGARVLVLGCGTGGDATRLARDGLRVVGLDSSAWSIRRAERDGAGVTGLRFVRGELPAVDGPDAKSKLGGKFDAVILRDRLFRRVSKHTMLEGAARWLREGGLLLGTEWVQARTATRRYWQRLFDTLWIPDLETREGCRALLRDARLAQIEVEPRDEEMRRFFTNRLGWLDRELTSGAPRSSDEMAVLLRARTDIGALDKLCSEDGPLGWVRFGAVARGGKLTS